MRNSASLPRILSLSILASVLVISILTVIDTRQKRYLRSEAAVDIIPEIASSSGATILSKTALELENLTKFNNLTASVPLHQPQFYLTYNSGIDHVVANLYPPDYAASQQTFFTWLIANGYGNLPREYFAYILLTVTPTPTPPLPTSVPTPAPTFTPTLAPTPTPSAISTPTPTSVSGKNKTGKPTPTPTPWIGPVIY